MAMIDNRVQFQLGCRSCVRLNVNMVPCNVMFLIGGLLGGIWIVLLFVGLMFRMVLKCIVIRSSM